MRRSAAAGRGGLPHLALVPGDEVHLDRPAAPHQLGDERAAQDVAPPPVGRLADDDARHVVLARVAQDLPARACPGQPDDLPAERLGQPQVRVQAIAVRSGHRERARRFHVGRDPRRAQPGRHPPPAADQASGGRARPDADQDALPGRPGRADPVLVPIGRDLGVDPLRGPPQRQLAQRQQVAAAEEAVHRAARLFRQVHLPLAEPLQELFRRQVDQLGFVRAVQHGVGHRLAHAHERDLRDHVVEALHVLHVDGRPDLDPGLTARRVLPAPMAAPVGVRVRQLVQEQHGGLARQRAVQVELMQQLAVVLHGAPGQHLQALEQCRRLLASVRLHAADHDVGSVGAQAAGDLEHGEGLADAGRVAEVDAQPGAGVARLFRLPLPEQDVRIRPSLVVHRLAVPTRRRHDSAARVPSSPSPASGNDKDVAGPCSQLGEHGPDVAPATGREFSRQLIGRASCRGRC